MKMFRKLVLIIIFLLCTQPLQHVAGYSAPKDATAEWSVVLDNVDAFTYLREGSKIGLTIIDANETTINALLVSTEYVDREEIIDYSESRCFPFVVSPFFLNASFNPLVDQIYSKTLFNVERDIAVIIIDRTLIHDNIEVTYILEYDMLTGLLVKWTIERTVESTFFQTIVDLTATTFWKYIEPNNFVQFFIDNKTTAGIIFVFTTAFLSMLILWKGFHIKKIGVIRFKSSEK